MLPFTLPLATAFFGFPGLYHGRRFLSQDFRMPALLGPGVSRLLDSVSLPFRRLFSCRADRTSPIALRRGYSPSFHRGLPTDCSSRPNCLPEWVGPFSTRLPFLEILLKTWMRVFFSSFLVAPTLLPPDGFSSGRPDLCFLLFIPAPPGPVFSTEKSFFPYLLGVTLFLRLWPRGFSGCSLVFALVFFLCPIHLLSIRLFLWGGFCLVLDLLPVSLLFFVFIEPSSLPIFPSDRLWQFLLFPLVLATVTHRKRYSASSVPVSMLLTSSFLRLQAGRLHFASVTD